MNIISEKPLILDYSKISDDGFMHMHVTSILRNPNDMSKGVNGLCRAGAFGRLTHILQLAGAPEPIIVSVINDPEAELAYELS
jgi:hypothetical protein|tara:strand:+ start:389 stop:637 length:249 start_codon:yes stop_codon:yes gene_type:complete